MDARGKRIAGIALLLFVTMGASYRTPNFVVSTNDAGLARQIAEAAEHYRSQLSMEWLGESIPNWSSPCTMNVHIGQNLGAGGATTFLFDRGEVYGWRMNIQGSRQRIFDSVLPHEITHMILASHFREPLPRWADEGAATSVECPSERQKQYRSLQQFLTTGRGIAFNRMFAMTEYPSDIMPLYAQGFSLTEYLIRQGGRRKYIRYLETAMQSDDWAGALREHYGVQSIGDLQNSWLAWIRNGRPQLDPVDPQPGVLASYDQAVDEGRRAPVSASSSAIATAIPATVPVSVPSPEPKPASGWHTRNNEFTVASDSPNPYAAAPIIDPSRPAARRGFSSNSNPKSNVSSGWLDPRTLASDARSNVMPAAEMVPFHGGGSSDSIQPANQTQMARQQPIQEAGQVILEWERR